VAIPASYPFIRKPPSLSWTDAAALPLVYGTVYTALVNYGRLPFDAPADTASRSVLILGGSSGTGSVGIQLAKKMGLKVVATCSGKNVDFVKDLGADEVIDYRSEDVATRALHSQYAPYAVVLDCVGGTELMPHLDHLILDDAQVPELGIYVTIVGDSESCAAGVRADVRNKP
jgi:NADPH:quinone reductase-like Zn-dependent oxidoreductase